MRGYGRWVDFCLVLLLVHNMQTNKWIFQRLILTQRYTMENYWEFNKVNLWYLIAATGLAIFPK